MKKKLCIIGSGVAGLQLAYALHDEFDITVIERRLPTQIKGGRITSTQVHFGPTRTRERRFQMLNWQEQPLIESIHLTIGNQKLFVGKLDEPALSVDQRLYYSDSIKDLKEKGISFRFEKIEKKSVEVLLDKFDLVIDCTGKQGPLFPFPIDEELSPFQTPQRKCSVGYFTGIKSLTPMGIGVTVLPELGEMFEIPAMTQHGPVTILFLMVVSSNELDVFNGIKSAETFTAKMKSTVKQFFPEIYSRMNEQNLRLSDEQGFLQTAVTPVIRKPYLMVKDKLVIGCGDSVFLNDPITGQGCNLSSYSAEQLYETLMECKNSGWDLKTGELYWKRTKKYVKEVTEWTNAMTQPLPEGIVQMLLLGAQDQTIANKFAEWFAHPTKAYEAFSSLSIK